MEREQSSHAGLLDMMPLLLKSNREGGTKQKSGGELRLLPVDTAGADAVLPSLDRFDDGIGSNREERGGAAGADPTGGQLGAEEQVWGVGLSGKLSITAAERLRSRQFLGQPKMAIPVSKGIDNFDTFSKQMRVYTKLHGFEKIFDTDDHVDIGAEGNEESLMAQRVPGIHARETVDVD